MVFVGAGMMMEWLGLPTGVGEWWMGAMVVMVGLAIGAGYVGDAAAGMLDLSVFVLVSLVVYQIDQHFGL